MFKHIFCHHGKQNFLIYEFPIFVHKDYSIRIPIVSCSHICTCHFYKFGKFG